MEGVPENSDEIRQLAAFLTVQTSTSYGEALALPLLELKGLFEDVRYFIDHKLEAIKGAQKQ